MAVIGSIEQPLLDDFQVAIDVCPALSRSQKPICGIFSRDANFGLDTGAVSSVHGLCQQVHATMPKPTCGELHKL